MRPRLVGLTLLVCLLWSAVGPAIKAGLSDAPPLGFAAIRMLLAGLALWAWARGRAGTISVEPKEIRPIATTTLFFCALMAAVYTGFVGTTAARGIVFINTTPFIVAVLAHFLPPREPLDLPKILGLLVAFGGIVAIFAEGFGEAPSPTLRGDLLILLAAIFWAFQTLYSKRASVRVNPIALAVWQFLGCAGVLGGISLLAEPARAWRLTPALAIATLYLAIPGTMMGWAIWTTVLQHAEASLAVSFFFTIPILGVFLSWLLLGESIGIRLALGALLVAAGILLVNLPGRDPMARAAP